MTGWTFSSAFRVCLGAAALCAVWAVPSLAETTALYPGHVAVTPNMPAAVKQCFSVYQSHTPLSYLPARPARLTYAGRQGDVLAVEVATQVSGILGTGRARHVCFYDAQMKILSYCDGVLNGTMLGCKNLSRR
jgi:hypothetical protein